MRMRLQVINALAPHDPEAALKFFHATRGSNNIANRSGPEDPELQLESSLVNHVVAADPKRAFALAEDMLNRTSSALLIETLTSLAAKDRTLAGRLASDMTKKVQGQELIKNADAAFLAGRLLQIVHTPQGVKQDGDATQKGGLLSDDEFRDLFLKVLSELLAYSPPAENKITPEFMAVRNLANVITQMAPEVKVYAPDRADATEKKILEITGSVGQPTAEWQRYQTAVTNAPVETALESVAQAPVQMRD